VAVREVGAQGEEGGVAGWTVWWGEGVLVDPGRIWEGVGAGVRGCAYHWRRVASQMVFVECRRPSWV
jgi:hypothetical protein